MFAGELNTAGFEAVTVETFRGLEDQLSQSHFDMIIPTNDDPTKGEGLEELVSRVRSEFPAIKILIMSGNGDLRLMIDCQRRGADDYVTLPFEVDDIVETIRKVLSDKEEPGSPKILLVCENDIGMILTKGLSAEGYDIQIVTPYASPNLVMEELRKATYDVVVPTNTGFSWYNIPALVTTIKAEHPTVKILVICSNDDVKYISDLSKRGISDYLTMPFDMENVITVLNRIVRE